MMNAIQEAIAPVGQPRDTDRTSTVSALSRLHGSVDFRIGHYPKDLNMRNSFILGSMMAVTVFNVAASADTVVYSNIPTTLDPTGYYSQAYQADSLAQFGDRINFGGTARQLTSVTTWMDSYAAAANWTGFQSNTTVGGVAGYTYDFTFNIYAAGSGSTPGALLGSVTQSQFVRYETGGPLGGLFAMTFDLSSLSLTAPDSIVYGLAFNTETYGATPTGVNGPYNGLNFALSMDGAAGITTGSNVNLDDVFWAQNGGAFQANSGWDPYPGVGSSLTPIVSFSAIPAPGALALLGVAGLAARRRRA